MINSIRKSFVFKPASVILTAIMLGTNLLPLASYALTSNYYQQEFLQYTPANSSQLVDPFTGDFAYNIPLFEIGGYPVNLGYRAGAKMDDEASWVGLGWNINPGAISRGLQGVPDDFRGDKISRTIKYKPFVEGTNSFVLGPNITLFGFLNLNNTYTFLWGQNNYDGVVRGLGADFGVGLQYSMYGVGAAANANIGAMHTSTTGFTRNVGATVGVTVGPVGAGFGWNNGLNFRTGNSTTLLSAGLDFSFVGQERSGDWYTVSSSALPVTMQSSFPDLLYKHSSKSFTFIGSFGIFGIRTVGTDEAKYVYQQREDYEYAGLGVLYSKNTSTRSVDEYESNGTVMEDYMKQIQIDQFSPSTSLLSQPMKTYDHFNVSGAGLSGTYKIRRNDQKVFYPIQANNISNNEDPTGGRDQELSIKAESFGWKEGYKGYYLNINRGKWNTPVDNILKPKTSEATENKFFQKEFELTPTNSDLYNKQLQRSMLTPTLTSNSSTPNLGNPGYTVSSIKGGTQNMGLVQSNSANQRSELLSYLSAEEASIAGRSKLLSFEEYQNGLYTPKEESRINTFRKKHHLSELSVLGTAGERFVYGLPVYNKNRTIHSFSIEGQLPQNNSLQGDWSEYNPTNVGYTTTDDSKGNNKGKLNLYTTDDLGPFASHFLLTEVLSNDYLDLTDNGISDDDLGNYTKFNYSRQQTDYNWRYPVTATPKQAAFEKGTMGLFEDDKCSYIAGSRENWYIHTIESKNEIAIFHLSERNDARPVSQDGVIDKATGHGPLKLDSVSIYSKYELNHGGNTPIKRVHFEYDYSLCNGVPNQNTTGQGKLTLKKVYFTYGNDWSGKQNPYLFSYHNFSYNVDFVDRWGNYKPEASGNTTFPKNMKNREFPFCFQNKSEESVYNDYAKGWNLETIVLPTGGKTEIEYEADRYKYVQDKKAQEMYQVAGFMMYKPDMTANSPMTKYNPSKYTTVYNTSSLYDYKKNDPKHFDDREQKEFIIVRLPDKTDLTFNRISKDIKNSYVPFNFLYYMHGRDQASIKERLGGFVKVLNIFQLKLGETEGVSSQSTDPNSLTEYACIQVDMMEADDGYHRGEALQTPMSHAILDYVFKHYPLIAFGNPATVGSYIQMMAREKEQANYGLYTVLEGDEIGKYVDMEKSWIRLNARSDDKFGGGYRVKSIKYQDNWNSFTSNSSDIERGHYYEQWYNYEDGVASYEPYAGAEENPFKVPVAGVADYRIVQQHMASNIPDEFQKYIGPVCENYYPNAMVGYSKVTTGNRKDAKVESTGEIKFEFYTYRDYPYETSNTGIDMKPMASDLSQAFASNNGFGYKTYYASQGFLVRTNNMHGKIKAVSNQNSDGDLINKVEYKYLETAGRQPHLNSVVKMLSKNGQIKDGMLGEDVDFTVEGFSQEETDMTTNRYYSFTVYGFLIPTWQKKWKRKSMTYYTDLKYMTSAKVVSQAGILESITYTDRKAVRTVKTELYDEMTGLPLSQSSTIEFNGEKDYSLTIPAYYAYKGMGPAYQNIRHAGYFTLSSGVASITGEDFVEGDEVLLETKVNNSASFKYSQKAWVASYNGSQLKLIDKYGRNVSDGQYTYTIIKSGYKNQLGSSIAQYASIDPLTTGNQLDVSVSKRLLSASVSTFTQHGNMNNVGFEKKTTAQISSTALDDFLYDINQLTTQNYGGGTPQSLAVYVGKNTYSTNGYTPRYGHGLQNFTGNKGVLFFARSNSEYGKSKFRYLTFESVDGSPITFSSNSITLPSSSGDFVFNNGIILSCNGKLVSFSSSEFPLSTKINSCTDPNWTSCGNQNGDLINPFLKGLAGIWKGEKAYVYNTDRTYAGSINSPQTAFNVKSDGYFNQLSPFWTSNYTVASSLSPKWINGSTLTETSPQGSGVETKDANNRYSASLLGYNNSTQIATVANSRYYQSGYDGFEDYDCKNNCFSCEPLTHFGFKPLQVKTLGGLTGNFIYKGDGHTGNHCLALGATLSMERELANQNSVTTLASPYFVSTSDRTHTFSPTQGKYVISFWAKRNSNADFSNLSLGIEVKDNGGNILQTLSYQPILAKEKEIEGWQKFEYVFPIPANASRFKLTFDRNPANSTPSDKDIFNYFIDDLRVHPFNATMVSYVYDNRFMRLMATLDDQNYATFYEYNSNGALARTKIETVKGIYTTKESISNLNKH